MSPIQSWFLETEVETPHHYTMSMLVELAEDLDEHTLRAALDAVIARHEALLMRFQFADAQWRQEVAPAESTGVFERHDLTGLDPSATRAAMNHAAIAAQTGMDITDGPLLRAVLFDFGPGRRPQLFLAVHHLVIDGVSWRILLEDLETAYRQVGSDRPADLHPEITTHRAWASALAEQTRRGAFDQDLTYWTGVYRVPADLPVDRHGPNTVSASRTVSARLDREATAALLRQVPQADRTQGHDVVLWAMSWGCA